MRGSMKQRYEGSWSLILDLGYQVDPKTEKRKRKQKWITFRGNKKQAEKKLNELVSAADKGTFVEPTRLTLGEWLREWVETAIKPPLCEETTYVSYTSTIENHIVPEIGYKRLQEVKALDLERYYASRTGLAQSSLAIHHAILHGALAAAVRADRALRNVAALVENKPKAGTRAATADQYWTAGEACAFLKTAKAGTPQQAAFYALALDSGARKSELAGLRWTDLDFATGRLTIERQLKKAAPEPVFGPTKTKKLRAIEIAPETLALLRAHKAQQAETKIANRLHYRDLGLIFAKEWAHAKVASELGLPLAVGNLHRELDRLAKAAQIKRITVHGLRHTCATLMLAAGVQPNTVKERLGHTKVSMTLDIYGHVLSTMQQDAATKLAVLLHG